MSTTAPTRPVTVDADRIEQILARYDAACHAYAISIDEIRAERVYQDALTDIAHDLAAALRGRHTPRS